MFSLAPSLMSNVMTNNSESVVILELPDHTTEKELSCIVSMESLKFPVERVDEGVTFLGVTTFASYLMIISNPFVVFDTYRDRYLLSGRSFYGITVNAIVSRGIGRQFSFIT